MRHDPLVFQTRIERLRELAEVDHLLILNDKNIRYLTGFTGSDGALLVDPDGIILLVDGRYKTQAGIETSGLEIEEFHSRVEGIAAVFNKRKAGVVGFESSFVSFGEYLHLHEALPGATLRPLPDRLNFLRAIKDEGEVALIKKAIRIAEKALTSAASLIKPGIREKEVAIELEYRMRSAGADGISFDTIVAAGPNSALPHATPGSRMVKNGDFVLIDYGAVFNGYHSDETRVFCVGTPSQKQREVYQLVQEAHDRAIMAIREGVSCGEIDSIARSFLEAKGMGKYFSHGTGHGVGLDVHEWPRLSIGKTEALAAGMVVTVEPGVYFPQEWGIRIEDMVLVTKDGCEVLTRPGRGLAEL